jgi:hypothetical protein
MISCLPRVANAGLYALELMSERLSTPSAEGLRQLAVAVSLDVARAPTEGRLQRHLFACSRDFASLESAMGATADALRKAGAHANMLQREAAQAGELAVQAPELCERLDRIASVFDETRRNGNIERSKGTQ